MSMSDRESCKSTVTFVAALGIQEWGECRTLSDIFRDVRKNPDDLLQHVLKTTLTPASIQSSEIRRKHGTSAIIYPEMLGITPEMLMLAGIDVDVPDRNRGDEVNTPDKYRDAYRKEMCNTLFKAQQKAMGYIQFEATIPYNLTSNEAQKDAYAVSYICSHELQKDEINWIKVQDDMVLHESMPAYEAPQRKFL